MPESDSDLALRDAKLRALAEFAAGAGHEINNPVATIIGYVQQLLPKETDPERRQALLTIGAQAYRIRDMIGDAMLFARPPVLNAIPENLAGAVREVAEKLRVDGTSGITWDIRAAAGAEVLADPVQLRVVISNLIRNALDALSSVRRAGRLVVEVDTLDLAGRRYHRLRVNDDGPGFSKLEREHAFDPFYSGRQAGRGLGFGLAKCWRIVTLHGGTIDIDSQPDNTTVTVLWPVTGPLPVDETAPPTY